MSSSSGRCGRASGRAQRVDAADALDGAVLGLERLRQQEPRGDEVRERQRRREERRRRVPEPAQEAADGRPEDEAQPERRADHAHALRAVLGRRDVGDDGLRRRDVRAGDAGEDARGEQRRAALLASPNAEIRQARSEQADRMIGRRPIRSDSRPQIGREDELHQRERRREHPHREGVRAERLRVERQQRDDDPEAQQVDEDRDEDDDQRGSMRGLCGCRASGPIYA